MNSEARLEAAMDRAVSDITHGIQETSQNAENVEAGFQRNTQVSAGFMADSLARWTKFCEDLLATRSPFEVMRLQTDYATRSFKAWTDQLATAQQSS